MINCTAFDVALKTAGIPIDGCDSTGTIWFRTEATDAQRAQAEAILADLIANPPPPSLPPLPAEILHPQTLADVIRAVGGDKAAVKRIAEIAKKLP